MEESPKYIYESPDGGKTVYRRRFLDYDTPRELIKDKGGFLIKDSVIIDNKNALRSLENPGVWFEF